MIAVKSIPHGEGGMPILAKMGMDIREKRNGFVEIQYIGNRREAKSRETLVE